MLYENTDLTFQEKCSLFAFRFKKRRAEKDIKCYWSLYHSLKLIKQNYSGETYEGQPIFDGTYSLSELFYRYKESRRKWLFKQLPAWFALIVSLVSLTMSIFNILVTTGIIILQ